jgi:ChrR-like protein with cupin domain/putative zinc finger protein
MTSRSDTSRCEHFGLTSLYALQAVPPAEMAEVEKHITECAECRSELETLRPVVDAFVAWPTDVLRPPRPLWSRLAERLGIGGSDMVGESSSRPAEEWAEPEWREVAPGIAVQLLSTDTAHDRVSLLVRLAPGVDYPPHRHAGIEELHLLDGELFIDDKKLHAGDFIRAERGSIDRRVWSETGCTCVLITSPSDVLR